MSVLSTADRVIEATGELRELRSRLTELDAERAMVQKRIETLLTEIGEATGSGVHANPETPSIHRRSAPASASEKILWMFEENPDATYNTLDIAMHWNEVAYIDAYRAALSRLAAQGKIRRIRHGWYSAIPAKPKV